MNSHYHARISAKKYGGAPQDYQELHDFIDSSKAALGDVRHRALLHNTMGPFEVTLKNGQFTIDHKLKSSAEPTDKWGVKTLTPVRVDTIMLSPNYWEDAGDVGNKHWFFILDGCKNPNPARGFFNEYLRSSLEKHRKVFEVLGAQTKCQPTDNQLSGVGFSSTRNDTVLAIADGRPYNVQF